MRAAGARRIVALVKEDVGTEVEDFRRDWWREEVLLDEPLQFYKALGGGACHQPMGLAGFLVMMLNPFSASRTKEHAKAVKAKGVAGNFVGEGFVTGGVYVMRPDGTAAYSFLEEEIGDHAPIEDVIRAVEMSSSEKTPSAM
mmetsp:Transcript_11764/g.34973  ORF Transcript_11764/g.34973 Transcript_11764/m.34973 type:complete len:142 (-) Transcript_11764:132-557(-)